MLQTPEERQNIIQRMAELKARMDEMRPSLNSTTIPKWVELYKEREALEQQLEDDKAP